MGYFIKRWAESILIFIPTFAITDSGFEIFFICCEFLADEIESGFERALLKLINESFAVPLCPFDFSLLALFN